MVKIDMVEYNTTCPDEAGATVEVKENIQWEPENCRIGRRH